MTKEELKEFLNLREFEILKSEKHPRGVKVELLIEPVAHPKLGEWCFSNIHQEFSLKHNRLVFYTWVNAELFGRCIQEVRKYYPVEEYNVVVAALEIRWELNSFK